MFAEEEKKGEWGRTRNLSGRVGIVRILPLSVGVRCFIDSLVLGWFTGLKKRRIHKEERVFLGARDFATCPLFSLFDKRGGKEGRVDTNHF